MPTAPVEETRPQTLRRSRPVKGYRVTHHLGGKTEIVLSLQGGEESRIQPVDGQEAGVVLGLLGSARDVKFDIVAKSLVVELVDTGGIFVVAPSVEDWLDDHHDVRNAIVWESSSSGPQAYKDWPQSRKDDLQSAFAKAWYLSSVDLTDPPPNQLNPGDDDGPTTVLSKHDARWLYLASVGQSLAVEIGQWVPWSMTGYSSDNLAILFDSRKFYTWSSSNNGYEISDSEGGYVVPSTPHNMYDFLKDNDLIGNHRRGTIVRLLKWCHDNLSHFMGPYAASNFEGIWQYRGLAPVVRTINGTEDQANPSMGVRHWTAGCHGTAGFLRAILRTVNIPVVHEHQNGHALPYFSADHAHLSHGDDPYNSLTVADPQFSMSELLLDQAKYDSWFGSNVSDADKAANVGKRTQELAIQYLSTELLEAYCSDKAAGKTHANGDVKANLPAYTVAELEAQDLWTRLKAKVASLGGCDQIN